MDILVFDDDPHFAELVSRVAASSGFSVDVFHESAAAWQTIQAVKPKMVVLDIMMPGVDGLSLCRAIKGTPATAGIKVVIFSGKGYAEDYDEASRCGADIVFNKVAGMPKVRDAFLKLLGTPTGNAGEKVARQAAMRLRVWGSSGGRPLSTALTSCVSLEVAGRTFVFDAGTGLKSLVAARILGADAVILMSHYHEDHVRGLRHLAEPPSTVKNIQIVGPSDTRRPLQEVLKAELGAALGGFQVKPSVVGETSFLLSADLKVSTLYTRHPGATLAYRIEHAGRAFVYAPDNEIEAETEDQIATDFNEKFRRFIRGATVLVHDARWLDEDYAAHAGQGHGCPERIVDMAEREGVRQLVLFHADAGYEPARLALAAVGIRERLKADSASLIVGWAEPDRWTDF